LGRHEEVEGAAMIRLLLVQEPMIFVYVEIMTSLG
jgi:hypothetical protein